MHDQTVGIGQHKSLTQVEEVARLPLRYRRNFLVRHSKTAQALAMLGEYKLASRRPAGPCLPPFAKDRVELAVGATVIGKALRRMFQRIGGIGENCPPVPARAGVGAGICNRIALAEQEIVERDDNVLVCLSPRHFAQAP